MHEAPSSADAAEARVRDFAGDRNSLLIPCPPTPREQAAMDRLIGARVAEARELAGISVESTASLVGIQRQELIRVEGGEVTAPLWMLARVATLTATSLDFLAGLTDESEVGEAPTFRALLLPHLLRADEQRAIQRLELQRQRRRIDTVSESVNSAWQTLQRTIELNPETWADMRGGARLADALATCVRVTGRLGSASTEMQP